MSDEETYQPGDRIDDSPPKNLGIPEKQPRDLGLHKVVFNVLNCQADPNACENMKPKNNPAEAITIVQDEYSGRDKEKEQKGRVVRSRVILASIICIIFIVLEFVGGYLSNSLVVVADATQLLTVFSTMMVSLFTLRLQARKPGQVMPVGWCQAEITAALASILTTWVLTSIVLYLAFQRLVREDFTLDVDMMLATSAFGVVANLVMGMVLHNNCHVQSCNGEPSRQAVNTNVRAAFIHILCDFLFSLAVFITALFIDCCPDWHIVDPASTFVFSIVVLLVTLSILKDVLNALMEAQPKGIYFNDVLKTFLNIDGVQQVQDLRLWAHSLDKIALSAHLTLRPGVDHNEVLKIASRRIHSKYNFYEMTLQVEAFADNLSTIALDLPEKK